MAASSFFTLSWAVLLLLLACQPVVESATATKSPAKNALGKTSPAVKKPPSPKKSPGKKSPSPKKSPGKKSPPPKKSPAKKSPSPRRAPPSPKRAPPSPKRAPPPAPAVDTRYEVTHLLYDDVSLTDAELTAVASNYNKVCASPITTCWKLCPKPGTHIFSITTTFTTAAKGSGCPRGVITSIKGDCTDIKGAAAGSVTIDAPYKNGACKGVATGTRSQNATGGKYNWFNQVVMTSTQQLRSSKFLTSFNATAYDTTPTDPVPADGETLFSCQSAFGYDQDVVDVTQIQFDYEDPLQYPFLTGFVFTPDFSFNGLACDKK